MTTFIIRDPRLADREQWNGLFNGYNRFYGREGSTALPDAIVDETWKRIFDPNEPVHALVAEQDGRLVALTHFLYHRSTTAIEMYCYLQDLFTAPEARGQGIARALIEAVYAKAAEAKAARVYWHTHESNATAQALYDRLAEKSGFIVYRKLLG
jgi:GNAT superfamily N-acetyltransferase